MMTADGFDDAVIGVGERCGQKDIVVYDQEKCIRILMHDGMSREDAEEYFQFNTVGAWRGEETPIWVIRCDAEDLKDFDKEDYSE